MVKTQNGTPNTRMSSIQEGKVLFLTDLPSGLISRRELRKHFSTFGTVDHISLDKNVGNCLISFSSYADALNAKNKGKLWNKKALNIYWDRKSSLDPRSKKENVEYNEANDEVVDVLWSDDDNECFGIDEDKASRTFKNKRKKTFNDLISSHLKPIRSQVRSGVKKQLLNSSNEDDSKKESEINRKKERTTQVMSEMDDKYSLTKSVKQDITKTKSPEVSKPLFGESILKRKVEPSKEDNITDIKRDVHKSYKLPVRTGDGILQKESSYKDEIVYLEEQGDNFIERKVIDSSRLGLPLNIKKNTLRQSKLKDSLKIIKKSRLNLVKKKSEDVTKSSKLSDDDSMLQLKNKIATTLKEKYNLLDERDKILRKREVKNSNVKTALAMKGTCPDMCPEKERIMRSFQRLVSVYEMGIDKNEMLENLAVKEYSRSSADQDEPLPHELRPEPVLSMTMNYLINNIINRIENPDENIAELYNFCWDRLRGIRKDIIQQQLCNLEAVEIIEQCARFHIFCYDYLWGLDVSIFDDKINIENLMNCLQSLMHMYEDLSKQGISCPNEAEFNAYMIVLKLSSGDTLWEYQSYSTEVRLSTFIRAAVNLYNAFNSKICSRFFNIVKLSPYLLACLSHRFFSNIRTTTLETITKAYTPGGKAVCLPLEYVKLALKFDNTEDVVMFCEGHGIFLSDNKQEFIVKKTSFYKPESVIQVKTFSSIIRNMRLTPAQAVTGEFKEIPKYIPHEVHSSFDNEGKLKVDALDASDQLFKVNSLFSKTSFVPQSPEISEATSPIIPSILTTTKDLKPAVEDTKASSFKFVLPQVIPSEENYIGSDLNSKPPVSTISQDVFKTLDNSFVEQDVLQIPIEELPQDLYDPFYDAQGNQFNDIQSVEIDAERVEEMYQDVKKYYEDVNKPNLKLDKSNNVNLNLSFKESESFPITFSKPSTSSELKNKENIFGNLGYEIFSTNKENEDFTNKSSLSPFNLKFNTDIKTKSNNHGLSLDHQHNLLFKVEDSRSYIENELKQNKEQEELQIIQNEKAKEELEKAKRELESKREKELEEAKLLKKLKKDLRERLKVKNARFYAKRWREKVEKLKKSREDFPMLVHLSVKDHLLRWGSIGSSKQPVSVGIVQRLKQRSTITNIVNNVLRSGIPNSVFYSGDQIAEEIASSAVTKFYKKGYIRPIFWKLIVSIPSGDSDDTCTLTKLIEVWCKKTFYKDGAELGSVQCIMTSMQIPVYTCVHLLKNVKDSKLCNGMSSFMFVTVNQWETSEQTLNRFINLVSSRKSTNSFFVSVMKIGGINLDHKLKEQLMLYKTDSVISDWIFQEWSNPNCVSDTLSLMAQHVSIVPDICATPIDFTLREIVDQFFSALSADQCSSNELRTAAHSPNNIIRLYNICIAKLEDLLISSKLEKYSHFPEEFHSYVSNLDVPGGIEQFSGSRYDSGYKMKISKIVQSLMLPEFTNWPPKSCNCLVNLLKSYCNKINNITLLPQIIRLIDISDDENEFSECLSSISWINITELWAKEIINQQIQTLNKYSRTKTVVLYNKQDLIHLVTSQWWLKTAIVVHSDF